MGWEENPYETNMLSYTALLWALQTPHTINRTMFKRSVYPWTCVRLLGFGCCKYLYFNKEQLMIGVEEGLRNL